MFKALQTELRQTRSEKEELQEKIKLQEEHNTINWENLLGQNNIEDSVNMISATMKNLTPPISIFQYYQAYKPLILKWSSLPDLRNHSHLSEEQFRMLWANANFAARDLLVCMWALRDLTIPKRAVEITTASPPFYLTRFCATTLNHIDRHHEEF